MRLAYTRIVTRDVPALAQFYKNITGSAPVVFNDAYVEFRNLGTALAISSQQTMESHGAGAATSASNRSVILDFQVDDVDQERARLAGTIDRFVLEPTNQPWGNRSMLFRDPDGNLINFFTPIRPDRNQGARK
jgi:catechol 2,3-dioxygenase-like lactoylglutathione lyase family enzyme